MEEKKKVLREERPREKDDQMKGALKKMMGIGRLCRRIIDLEEDGTDQELCQPVDVDLIVEEPHVVCSDEQSSDEFDTFEVPKAPEVGMIFYRAEEVKAAFHLMPNIREGGIPPPSKYDSDQVLKDKSDIIREKNADRMTYTLVDGKWVSNLLLNEPSTLVTKGEKRIQLRKFLSSTVSTSTVRKKRHRCKGKKQLMMNKIKRKNILNMLMIRMLQLKRA
ncbi:hypothetical protein Syun_030061 [Stephania yunnanensis]|uniref:Uncharacterized protein n=1 Tax=Stephania yunnanensis TaxID=152371 RepID=A0AAP0EA43_9MAGN